MPNGDGSFKGSGLYRVVRREGDDVAYKVKEGVRSGEKPGIWLAERSMIRSGRTHNGRQGGGLQLLTARGSSETVDL